MKLQDVYPLYLNNKAAQPNTDLAVTDKFTGEVAFRTALATPDIIDEAIAGAVRATGLRHEAFDHAMEWRAVIKALTGQLLDAGHVLRRHVRQELDCDSAVRELDDERVFRVQRPGRLVQPTEQRQPAVAWRDSCCSNADAIKDGAAEQV